MEMIAKREYSSGYGSYSKMTTMKPQDFYDHLAGQRFNAKQEKDRPNGIITTRLSRFPLSQHVLAIDCDDPESLASVKWYLNRDEIDHVVIESTPDHYWVIGNKVERFGNLMRRLREYKGADLNWLRMCKEYGYLSLRAFPKAEYPDYPRFLNDPFRRGTPVGEWYYEFQSWFRSVYFESLVEMYCGVKTAILRRKPTEGNYCSACGTMQPATPKIFKREKDFTSHLKEPLVIDGSKKHYSYGGY